MSKEKKTLAFERSQIQPVFSSCRFEVVTVNDRGAIIKREKRSANYYREDLGNRVDLDAIAIPGGTFMMGSPEGQGYEEERPQHQVTVKSFCMGKTPITQAQWREVVAQVATIERELDPDPSRFKGDRRPVEGVSWYDAIEFCTRLSRLTGREYRLPSEAEWEYACRAISPPMLGGYLPFHFGETITTDLANYKGHFLFANESKGQYRQGTTPVDEFIYPNAFGLYDLHGNVLEWCLDSWHDNYEGAPNHEEVWENNSHNLQRSPRACARGGYWYFCPDACRSSKRFSFLKETDRGIAIGLRVVSDSLSGDRNGDSGHL